MAAAQHPGRRTPTAAVPDHAGRADHCGIRRVFCGRNGHTGYLPSTCDISGGKGHPNGTLTLFNGRRAEFGRANSIRNVSVTQAHPHIVFDLPQQVTQPLPPPLQQGFHGTDRRPHDVGDLDIAQVLVIGQHQRDPLLGRQPM